MQTSKKGTRPNDHGGTPSLSLKHSIRKPSPEQEGKRHRYAKLPLLRLMPKEMHAKERARRAAEKGAE